MLGYVLLSLPWVERGFVEPWTALNVKTAATFARPLVEAPQAIGTRLIAVGAIPLEARKGCDGISALLILCTTILAFPAPWRARLTGLVLGTVAIFVLNACRITTLLLVAVHWPDRLDFFHVDVWQPAMMLFSFALFILWGARIGGTTLGRSGQA